MTGSVRVAIAGVGNCASAFVQGLQFYRGLTPSNRRQVGLVKLDIGGLTVSSIEVVAAIDVSVGKVGLDLAEAVKASPNCTREVANVAPTGVIVECGPLLDGLGEPVVDNVKVHPEVNVSTDPGARVVRSLRSAEVDVLVNTVPVGARSASNFYAVCALHAGCAFINAIPVKIGRDAEWRVRYADAGLPLLGDDIKSQVGATIVHRALVELFAARGYSPDATYQLNVGGTWTSRI